MNATGREHPPRRPMALNAVPLQNAVLCAECDVVSDSPQDTCMVCGSRSLFNIARVFGGKLPKQRVSLVAQEAAEVTSSEMALSFRKPHRLRRKATPGPRQFPIVTLDNNDRDEVERGVLFGPKPR
jgi:hypothetical protein